ncbi:Hypothetical predicted protein [Podarcis lilfordi]|uniref:Uncharacterized protein n=1 Tax=Podarcis lilfordi TaxID=74358 RepID=A0AA35JRC3_9SAUR|nr:Hypothetical predicted protein [Podarcis lilfordi]
MVQEFSLAEDGPTLKTPAVKKSLEDDLNLCQKQQSPSAFTVCFSCLRDNLSLLPDTSFASTLLFTPNDLFNHQSPYFYGLTNNLLKDKTENVVLTMNIKCHHSKKWK